jgi:hypothetical protein
MLFITLDDEPIGSSLRPAIRSSQGRVHPTDRTLREPTASACPSRPTPREPTHKRDSTISRFTQSFFIKGQLFSAFGQSFCYIVAIALSDNCYSAQSFYRTQSFLIAIMLSHFH